jgi:hypothetical protein
VRVVRGSVGFESLLRQSDAVILDLPSTILLQALSLSKPTFVLMRYCRYSDELERSLRRAAFCVSTATELVAPLERFVAGESYLPDANDSSFLRAVGTNDDDGETISRVVEVLRPLIFDRSRSAAQARRIER